MHRSWRGVLAVGAACGLLWPTLCHADEDPGQLVAIQQRKYRLVHEIELAAAFAPLDAFDKGLGGEASYALHFTDAFAWEIVRAGYFAQIDTGLRTQLLQEFGVVPTQFQTLQYYASSVFEWSPAYGKLAWNNTAITHVELFFTLGAAAGWFTGGSVGVGPEAGVGLRIFISPLLSWRIEARDAYLIQHNSQNVLFLSTGLSFNFGARD
jgi:outer membrane beta-barrel protein